MRVDRNLAHVGDKHGVAVRRGLCHLVGADDPAGAAAVLDHHLLPKRFAYLLPHEARHGVGKSACGVRNDNFDGSAGVALRERRKRRDERQGKCHEFHCAAPPRKISGSILAR
jgi:hypothetical protein